MGKRIVSVLLIAALLFTMDGTSLYAMESSVMPQECRQSTKDADLEGQQKEADDHFGSKEGLQGESDSSAPGDGGGQEPGTSEPEEGSGQEPGTSEPEDGGGQGSGTLEPEEGSGQEPEDGGEQEPGTSESDGSLIGNSQNPGTEEGDQSNPSGRKYTIKFNLAGGKTPQGQSSFSIQVPEGQMPDGAQVLVPVKKGYLFQGWKRGTGAFYMFDQPVTGDFSLLAAWTPVTYRVKFDLNGGTGKAPTEQIMTYDKKQKLPGNTGKKSGYVFAGWKHKNGISQGGAYVKNLAEQEGAVVVLKAVWKRGSYKVRYDANGGKGSMKVQVLPCGVSKTLSKNKYVKTGYSFVKWNTRKDGKGKSYKDKQKISSLSKEHGSVVTLFAVWKGNSYKVEYKGNGADSGKVAGSKHEYGKASKLKSNKFKRKGYTFVGWNTRKDGKGKTYKSGAKVDKLTAKANGKVTLYAKWKVKKYDITYSMSGGKVSKSAKKAYTIKTKTYTLPNPSRKGYDFDGWYKDKKYKKRVTQIKKGSTGERKFYAKWVKCSRPPKSNSAKLTTCKATGTGTVKIRATIKHRVVSDDGCYYLMYVNPSNGKPYKMEKKTYKKKKLSFTFKTAKNQGYVVSMFGIAVKKKGKYKLISSPSYVKYPEKAAKNKSKYKLGKTKKGIQFTNNMEELAACKAKNTFLNLNASDFFINPTVAYQYNGKTYYFNSLDLYKDIVSNCNKKGINVTMQVMLDWTEGNQDLISSKARKRGAAPYYMWNISNNSAREKMEAMFCYAAKVFGTKKCYVSNWILGNEINNPVAWNYKGGMSEYSYMKSYAIVFRTLYTAVRSQSSNAHLFICTDNFWNAAVPGGYSAKHVINSFVNHLKKVQKGLKWNLAFHAYSYPLTYTNFWDGYGITHKSNTPYVTMKNLKVMTDYIKKKYGSSVRIILSEQGYSSAWGETNQAAAIAYSYYIAACNPMIDAFIIRSYYDHPEEVVQGLSMGIAGKVAFIVFRHMDTAKSFHYTKPYLAMIGKSSWEKAVPGYKKSRIYKMYRKG